MSDTLKENYTNLKIKNTTNMRSVVEALIDEGYTVTVKYNESNNSYSIVSYIEVPKPNNVRCCNDISLEDINNDKSEQEA